MSLFNCNLLCLDKSVKKKALCLLGALGVAGTSLISGIDAAQARSDNSWGHDIPLLPGQERVKYKISNISDDDVVNFCHARKRSRIYVGYKHERVQVRCLYVYVGGEGGANLDLGAIIKKGNYEVSGNISAYDNPRFTPVEEAFPTDAVCEHKHPRMGTYNIEGGRACEDSYRRWKK